MVVDVDSDTKVGDEGVGTKFLVDPMLLTGLMLHEDALLLIMLLRLLELRGIIDRDFERRQTCKEL